MSLASIIVLARNESNYIKNCLESLLLQSYNKLEIIIVNDNSNDDTEAIILSFEDNRIKLFNIEKEEHGYGNLRNYGLEKSIGKYIFFTDADCIAHYKWVEEAVNEIENNNCIGVEGKTFYEAEGAITVSDYFTYRVKPQGYMTCNVAYLKESIIKVDGFNSRFKYIYEDRDLGIRISRIGEINFCKNMLIFHQQKKLNIKNLFTRAKRAGDMVYFDYKHGRKNSEYIKKNIMYPGHLIIVFFPPLIFLTSRMETIYDIYFTFMKYISFIYERLIIWKKAIKYKKLIF